MKQLLNRTSLGARWLVLGVAGASALACSAHSLGEERPDGGGYGGTAPDGGPPSYGGTSPGGAGGQAAQGPGGQGASGGSRDAQIDRGTGDPDAQDTSTRCPADCSGPGGAQFRVALPNYVLPAPDSVWLAVVCHNDNCATLDAVDVTNSTIVCAGKDRVYGGFMSRPTKPPQDRANMLVISWGFGEGTVLADGDEYSIRLTAGEQTVISTQRASYEPAVSVCQTRDVVMAVFPNQGGEACCARDAMPSATMSLGGPASLGGDCVITADFFCSENWRVEFDDQGCEIWRYDVQGPGTCDAGGIP
jgi:hypothetical protein